MADLTEQQARVLQYIRRYIYRHGYAPSRGDISRAFGFRPNAAQDHVAALAKKGVIKVAPGIARGIVLP